MIILFATSKTMDFTQSNKSIINSSIPSFLDRVNELSKYLKSLEIDEIKKIMKVSDKIAKESNTKFREFSLGKNKERLKHAVFTFTGEVFKGLDPLCFNNDELEFCNQNLRILSGLYGILSPLDVIEPYRLEMGYKIDYKNFTKVSSFWKDSVTTELNSLIKENNSDLIIDLASKEYTDSIDKKKLNTELTDIVFKENKDGKYKTIAVYSKKARGKMANYIIKNKIKDKENIKYFNEDGYEFNDNLSTDNKLIFLR